MTRSPAAPILQQKIGDGFERAFAVFGLMMMIGTLQILFGTDFNNFGNPAKGGGVDGNLGYQIAGMAIYAVSLFLVIQRADTLIAVVRRNKAFCLFLLYTLVSALWADTPGVTVRRSLALIGTSVFALYLVMRFESNDFLRLLAIAFGLTAVLNLLFTAALPGVGLHPGGELRGMMGHKNVLGRTMILGALAFALLARGATLKKPFYWAGFALTTGLVVLSMSRTAWITMLFLMLVFIPFLNSLRRSRLSLGVRMTLVLGVGLTTVVMLVLDYWQSGLALFGRDATFTGRTVIWEYVIMAAWERPWFGYGHQAFWTGSGKDFVYTFITWGEFGHAHNAYIDLWANLGFVGCGLFAASLLIAAQRMFVRLTKTSDPIGVFYPCAILLLLILSFSANMFPQHGSIFWVIYSATLFYLSPIGFTAPRSTAQILGRLRPAPRRFAAPT
jgi:exopolysaccharide production protein ExoQ